VLRIPCPYCGTRDEPEFSFGGQAHVVRPSFRASDAEWTDYLFIRENPIGVHHERWCHVYGCERWFNVVRDTVTHEILFVYRMGEAEPILRDGKGVREGEFAGQGRGVGVRSDVIS
jgi:heterotetrameric sarcosine oxidase delta subunit